MKATGPRGRAHRFRLAVSLLPWRSSRLRLEDQDRCFFFVVGGSRDVITIEFRRPKRRTGAGPRGNPSNLCVVIGVVLLVDEHRANIEASAAGNVDALMRRIKIDAI